jgi:hypothetical protein
MPEGLRLYIQENVYFEMYSARSRKVLPIATPDRLVAAYMGNPRVWKLRVLNGIVESPCLRADGTILQTEGYDPASGLIADFNGVTFPEIPENPTFGDAVNALNKLNELLGEFPFVDAPSRGVALSGILTMFQRRAMRDCPMHGIDANSVGTGKSTLGHTIAIIGTGREAVTCSLPTNEIEFKKLLFSALRENPTAIMIDNVPKGQAVTGSTLCTILTQPRWSDRVLSESRDQEVSTQALFMANGNNLLYGGDMASRGLRCRMNRNEDRPDQHKFTRDVLAYTSANRPEFVAAALTILRGYLAWINAGRQQLEYRSNWRTGRMEFRQSAVPKYTNSRFKDWDRMIREPLLWLKVGDPWDTAADVFEDDPGQADLASLIEALHKAGATDKRRMTVGTIAKLAEQNTSLAAALGDHADPRKLTFHLRGYLDTPCEGRAVRRGRGNDNQWQYWISERQGTLDQ